jgi:hypothetical protein
MFLSTLVDSSSQKAYSSDQTTIGASHLLKFREHYVQENKPISLFQAMSWTLHTMATDPRDKIFALPGLCHDGMRLVPVPNYRQSLESIISDMSRSMITLNRSLDIVCLKGSNSPQTQHPELPTWAPNWLNLWGGSTTPGENEILEKQATFAFNPILPGSTDTVIQVQGVCIGRISGISRGFTTTTGPRLYRQHPGSHRLHFLKRYAITPAQYKQQKCIWKTMTMSLLDDPELYASQSCFQALWTPNGRGSIYNTKIIDWIDCNASFRIEPSPPQSPSRVGGARDTLKSFFIGGTLMTHGKKTPPKVEWGYQRKTERGINPWPAVNDSLEKVLRGGMRLAELRAVIPQRSQDYPESSQNAPVLVSPYAEVSDEIFFLRGCSLPVILRRTVPVLDQYAVIGGAWLDLDNEWFRACHEVAAGYKITSFERDGSRMPTMITLSLE